MDFESNYPATKARSYAAINIAGRNRCVRKCISGCGANRRKAHSAKNAVATTIAHTKPQFDLTSLNMPFLMTCNAGQLNQAACRCLLVLCQVISAHALAHLIEGR